MYLSRSCKITPFLASFFQRNLPFLVPVDSSVIHFINKHNQMLNTGSFGQQGMLLCLTTLFVESGLKFAFTGGYDLNRDINDEYFIHKTLSHTRLVSILHYSALVTTRSTNTSTECKQKTSRSIDARMTSTTSSCLPLLTILIPQEKSRLLPGLRRPSIVYGSH